MNPVVLTALQGIVATTYVLSMVAFLAAFCWFGVRLVREQALRANVKRRGLGTVWWALKQAMQTRGVFVVALSVMTLLLALWERGERGVLHTRMEEWDARVGREFFPQQRAYHEAVHRLSGRVEGAEASIKTIAAASASAIRAMVERQRQFEEREIVTTPPEYAGRTGWSRRR